MNEIVIGIGNRYRGDDAAGPIALDRLADRVPECVPLFENSGDAAAIIEAWRDRDRVVLIDAVESGAEPGTVHRLDGRSGVPGHWRLNSTHLMSLGEAVELSWAIGCIPDELLVFGIEVGQTDHTEELSPEVDEAIDEVVEWVLADLEDVDA